MPESLAQIEDLQGWLEEQDPREAPTVAGMQRRLDAMPRVIEEERRRDPLLQLQRETDEMNRYAEQLERQNYELSRAGAGGDPRLYEPDVFGAAVAGFTGALPRLAAGVGGAIEMAGDLGGKTYAMLTGGEPSKNDMLETFGRNLKEGADELAQAQEPRTIAPGLGQKITGFAAGLAGDVAASMIFGKGSATALISRPIQIFMLKAAGDAYPEAKAAHLEAGHSEAEASALATGEAGISALLMGIGAAKGLKLGQMFKPKAQEIIKQTLRQQATAFVGHGAREGLTMAGFSIVENLKRAGFRGEAVDFEKLLEEAGVAAAGGALGGRLMAAPGAIAKGGQEAIGNVREALASPGKIKAELAALVEQNRAGAEAYAAKEQPSRQDARKLGLASADGPKEARAAEAASLAEYFKSGTFPQEGLPEPPPPPESAEVSIGAKDKYWPARDRFWTGPEVPKVRKPPEAPPPEVPPEQPPPTGPKPPERGPVSPPPGAKAPPTPAEPAPAAEPFAQGDIVRNKRGVKAMVIGVEGENVIVLPDTGKGKPTPWPLDTTAIVTKAPKAEPPAEPSEVTPGVGVEAVKPPAAEAPAEREYRAALRTTSGKIITSPTGTHAGLATPENVDLVNKGKAVEGWVDKKGKFTTEPGKGEAALNAEAEKIEKESTQKVIWRGQKAEIVEWKGESTIIKLSDGRTLPVPSGEVKHPDDVKSLPTKGAAEQAQPKAEPEGAPGGAAFSYQYRGERPAGERVAFELPELVRMATDALGTAPSVFRKLRGKAIGRFWGEGSEGSIGLQADISKGPIIKAYRVKAAEADQMIDGLKRKIVEEFPNLDAEKDIIVTKTWIPQGNKMLLQFYRRDPNFAGNVLAHEIGHAADWLPDWTLKRGNLLGRVASLSRFMGKELEGMNNTEIRAELKGLTLWWNNLKEAEMDKNFKKYKFSGKELYADALSVLLNDPQALAQRAPKFSEGFFRFLDRKPEVKRIYDEITNEIKSGTQDAEITKRRREGYMKGEEAKAKELEDRTRGPLGQLDMVRIAFQDKAAVVKALEAKAHRTGLRDIDATEAVNSAVFGGARIEYYMQDVGKAKKTLDAKQLSAHDLSEYMEMQRIANERKEILNPMGFGPERAQRRLDEMKQDFGPERYAALEQAHKQLWQARQSVIDLLREYDIFSPALMKKIESNEFYSPFHVVEYLNDAHGAGSGLKILAQHGTLKPVAAGAGEMIEQDAGLIRSAYWNNAKKSVVELVREQDPSAIRNSERKWDGKRLTVVESKDPRWKTVLWLEGGVLKGADMHPKYAAAVERSSDSPVLNMGVKALRAVANPTRMVFTVANPGFWTFNLIRDYQRAAINLPGTGPFRPNFIKQYLGALPHILRGNNDPLVREMLKGTMLISVHDTANMNQSDLHFERQLAQWNKTPREWESNVMKPVQSFMSAALAVKDRFFAISAGIERLPKVAGYKYLKENQARLGLSDAKIANMVREEVGSPAFLTQGAATPVTNNIFLFSNAMIQATVSDVAAMRGAHGKEIMLKRAAYGTAPKVLMYGLASGAVIAGLKAMGLSDDDEAVKWATGMKRMYDGISEYNKTNYTSIPLGMTPQGKTLFFRTPQDELSRLIGGLVWKGLQAPQRPGKMAEQSLAYGAGQAPSLNPIFGVFGDAVSFFAGRNPYDEFRGQEKIGKRAWEEGWPERHKAMAKALWRDLGGSIVYEFKSDQPGEIRTELEQVLGAPVASNLMGRFIKVSDYGLSEQAKQAAEPVQEARAKELSAVDRAMVKANANQPLTQEESDLLIANQPYVKSKLKEQEERRQRVPERFGKSKAEKAAIQERFQQK